MRIGILVEDSSDYDAVRELVKRFAIRAQRRPPGTKPWIGKGCGKFAAKAARVLTELERNGCTAFIVVQDLDRTDAGLNNEAELRQRLMKLHVAARLPTCICIPVEELEAWFLACPKVMRHVTGEGGQDHQNPHLIARPKETLHKLSRAANKKPRLSTNANGQLAGMLDLDVCEQRCPALRQLGKFIEAVT
jgi:hypothetical protein